MHHYFRLLTKRATVLSTLDSNISANRRHYTAKRERSTISFPMHIGIFTLSRAGTWSHITRVLATIVRYKQSNIKMFKIKQRMLLLPWISPVVFDRVQLCLYNIGIYLGTKISQIEQKLFDGLAKKLTVFITGFVGQMSSMVQIWFGSMLFVIRFKRFNPSVSASSTH